MRVFFRNFLLTLFSASVFIAGVRYSEARRPPVMGFTFYAKLERNKDGDTSRVIVSFPLDIRYLQDGKFIEAPEKNTPAGKRSLVHLTEYAKPGDDVIVHIPLGSSLADVASFERLNGEIFPIKGRYSYSEWQTVNGFAKVVKNEQ